MNNKVVRKDGIEVWGVFHDDDRNCTSHELVKCFFAFKRALDYAYTMRDEHGWYIGYPERWYPEELEVE